MLFVRPIARFASRLSVHEDNMTLNAAAWSSKHASVPCQSLVASRHIVGASSDQSDNWHPNEPRRAGIFATHNAIKEREAG